MTTRLIELTRPDASKVQVGVSCIATAHARGTGALLIIGGADPNNTLQEVVTEAASAVASSAGNLITLTRLDTTSIYVNRDLIVRVVPRGTGSTVVIASNDPNNSLSEQVTETPAQVTTAANV